MTNTKPLTVSERSARALLAAWNTGELARLEAALDGPAALQDARLPASERERIELVREVANCIRAWLQGAGQKAQTDLQASLKLLRHLARCEDFRNRHYLEDLDEQGALSDPSITVPRPGTPVFVRN
jgi:hypothetical protein